MTNTPDETISCDACGTKCSPTATFCSSCGKPMTTPASTGRGPKRMYVLAAVGAVVVIAAVVAGLVYLDGHKARYDYDAASTREFRSACEDQGTASRCSDALDCAAREVSPGQLSKWLSGSGSPATNRWMLDECRTTPLTTSSASDPTDVDLGGGDGQTELEDYASAVSDPFGEFVKIHNSEVLPLLDSKLAPDVKARRLKDLDLRLKVITNDLREAASGQGTDVQSMHLDYLASGVSEYKLQLVFMSVAYGSNDPASAMTATRDAARAIQSVQQWVTTLHDMASENGADIAPVDDAIRAHPASASNVAANVAITTE